MKFYGAVGFWDENNLLRPGVVKPGIVERNYYGEVLQNMHRWDQSEHQTDDLKVSNRISILSDPYAHEHWPAIKYVVWNGVKWKASSIDIQYPRLIITLGEVYNGSNGN